MMSSRPDQVPLPGEWKPHLKKIRGRMTIVNGPLSIQLLAPEEAQRLSDTRKWIYYNEKPGLKKWFRK